MSWLRILAYYAVAAVLTLHLVSITSEPEGKQAEGAATTAPFLEAVPERIDRVRMENDQLAIQFEKRDGRWVTTEPEGLAPPGDVIDAVLESLTSLPAIEIVADADEGQDQFGLVPPRMRIRIEQQGALISTVVLGELSPTRTAVYAKKSGNDEVALIGLNSKYYIDLVFENVRRQRGSSGVPTPPDAVATPPDAALPRSGGALPPMPKPGSAPVAVPPAGGQPPAGE